MANNTSAIPADRSTHDKTCSCYHCGKQFERARSATQCEKAHERNGATTGDGDSN